MNQIEFAATRAWPGAVAPATLALAAQRDPVMCMALAGEIARSLGKATAEAYVNARGHVGFPRAGLITRNTGEFQQDSAVVTGAGEPLSDLSAARLAELRADSLL